MYNFNNEEQMIHDIYKGETAKATISNLQAGLKQAPEGTKIIISRVIKIMQNRN